DEERRLAYVGITRAKRRLYVTRAAVRAQWGQASDMMPSQFLDEIPDEDYIAILRPLIQRKWKTVTGRNDYERSMKLIRFAMGRGFDIEQIKQCIDQADDWMDD
ncbi:MAG: RecX family transcriptional regulator, partial [Prevotella buccalis]|nr:RecX family transcriptional regulator [Hoylesella buccalis]